MSDKLQAETDKRIEVERALFENSGTAVVLIASDGNILLTNDEFVRLTGYSKSVLEHDFNFLRLVTAGDRDRIHQLQEDQLVHPASSPQSYEFLLVDRQGSEKSVLSTVTALPGSKSIILSLIDISQRKIAKVERENAIQDLQRAEEELRTQNENLVHAQIMIEEERQRYHDLFDSASDAYLVTTLEGRISDANRAASSLLGASPNDLNGRLLIDFLKEEDRRTFRARFARLAAEPGYALAGFPDWEVSVQRPDGSLIEASIAVTGVRGIQGKPASLRWLLRDISAAKRVRIALQKSEALYDAIANTKTLLVCRFTPDTTLTFVNEAYCNFMGKTADELIGQSFLTFIPRVESHEFIRETIRWVVEPRGGLEFEQHGYNAAGEEYWQRWVYNPIYEQEKVAEFQAVGFDITPRRKAEQALRNNAVLERRNRLARELHDSVAQTLYSISLFANATRLALESNKLDVVTAHLQELTQLSRQAISDMRSLIFELCPPILKKDGLAAALQSRLDSVEPRAGFQPSLYTEGELSFSAEEESELYCIAEEALDNVTKHAQANHVRVELIEREGSISLTIMDDGVGFDPEAVAPQSGQGLRNIRERAQHIGAVCSVTSAPGQGTKITIEVQNNEPELHNQGSHR